MTDRVLRSAATAFLFFAGCAAAQSIANWNTGAGNWANAVNWDCTIGGGSSHCIPGAGFVITNIGGDITVDINTSIAYLLGTGGSLSLNSKSLTATDPLGIQMTNGLVNLTAGAVINGSVIAGDLTLQNSSINGTAQANNATITNSSLGSLAIANSLNASGSTIGSKSNLTLNSASSISSSNIGGTFSLVNGASLKVDSGSVVNATQSSITAGSLTLQGGATWNATTAPVFVGVVPGSSSIDVTDTGTAMNLTNAALELGELGNAAVTVEHGGTVTATGAGGNFLIGLGVITPTTSTMLVNSGGTASANNITVESPNGSTGILSVSDSSSRVTAAGQLLLANGGVVNVANQSSFTADSFRIQSGSATIDSGATFQVNSSTAVLIGSAGTGSLTIQDGGSASSPGELVFGTSVSSVGTATITGLGSAWHGDANVSVGDGGNGSIRVLSGGLLETGSDGSGLSGSLGTQSTGVGTVTLQGGDWQAGGTLHIGAAGTGTLSLLQGGTLESDAAQIGVSASGIGSVSVADPGSKWTLSGDLTVGSGGRGSLAISNGGVVTNQDATIGELATSTNASVSVTGVGSRWVNSGKLTVGENGSGSLSISGGAVVTSFDAVIGDKKGSNGSVTVAGLGTSWQNSGILTIGGDGAASLTVDTGTVTAGGAAMGSNFSPVQVTITNHGTLSVLGDVSIGGAAPTDLLIENGGTLESGNNATIGGSGGDSTVTVTGTDSSWTVNGTGSLTIDDKGSLFVMDGGTVSAATITVDSGGLINGQGGNIVGSIFNMGGTVTPGDATGIMSVTGNYTQTAGTLLFEIDGLGPGQFDQMLISGLANISGGSIEIEFGNGFSPVAGENFDLISAALGLTIANTAFDVIGLPSDLHFSDSIGSNGLELSFTDTSATPEPGAFVLFALGLGCMLLIRRRAVHRRGKNAIPCVQILTEPQR